MQQALLLIDIQHGFINECTQSIPAFAERIQNDYRHVYVSRFINAENSMYRKLMKSDSYGKGSPEAGLAFEPRSDAFIYDKNGYTSATPELLEDLQRKSIDTVYLAGMDLDACVAKTALDLFENNIRPVVLIKGCAVSVGEVAEGASIRNLARLIGHEQVVMD